MAEPEHVASGKRAVPVRRGVAQGHAGGTVPQMPAAGGNGPAPTGPSGTVVLPRFWAVLAACHSQVSNLATIISSDCSVRVGWARLFEAEDGETGRRVALKVLSHTLDLPEARERFFREGRLRGAQSSNSVYVFGTEEIGGIPVIAMELVSGGTLQDRVRAQGPLPTGATVDCVLQLIAASKRPSALAFCIAMLSLPTVIGPRMAPSKSAISVCRFRQPSGRSRR